MSPTKNSEKQDFSTTNGHAKQEKKQEVKGQTVLKRVYTRRNSILTDLMEVNHLQSVYNINVAVCSLLFMNSVIFYLADPDKFWQDVRVVKWGAGKVSHFLILWLLVQVFALATYEGFRLWVAVRNKIHTKIADGVFLLLYVASIVFMYTATPFVMLSVHFPPITGFATAAEQVRVSMKIYSFVRENVPRVRQYKPSKDGNQQRFLCPPRKHYFYYLFAPALIYKDTYPRTEKIQWENVFYNLFKFAGVIFVAYCVFMRFNVDMFKDVGLQQFSRKDAALVFAGSMGVGCIMMFLIFYGILHCWLNVFAELLKFGDRQFYLDWWNSTSFSQYYRRWNLVVSDWLHAYIYTETQRFGSKRSVSMVLVFCVSAMVHEYIICLSLGFFYPVLLVVYTTIGIFVIFLTKERTAQFWNTFMWFMLFSGWGVVICCYSSEWYARINCPKKETSLDFFIPRSWDPSCHILNIF